MYDLSVDGARDLSRYTSLLGQRKISHDPLSGLVDGYNVSFLTQYSPVLTSGSLTAYHSSGSIVVTLSIDYDTGEVIFPSAPNYQPTATYTATPYTSWQLKSFLMAGFDEMQSRWPRDGWFLSSSGSVFTAPVEDDADIYIVYKDAAGNMSDPLCPVNAFSLSRTQIRFYMACCEYAYLSRQLEFSSETSISFRETRGAAVDRQQIPKNIDMALERVEKRLISAMLRAQEEYGDNLGVIILPLHTEDYEENYRWYP